MSTVAGWAVLGAGTGMLAGAAGRALLGRLRRGTTIPPPWCELAVGALWAVIAGVVAAGAVPWEFGPLLCAAAWLGVAAGVVDVRHHRLPDALTLPALPAAVLLAAPLGWSGMGRALGGAALLAGAHLLVHALSPGALGLGDVKLAGPVGALLGAVSWPALLVGCALAAGISAVVGGLLVVRGGAVGRRRIRPGGRPVPAGRGLGELPHGPSMLAAGWLVALAGALQAGMSAAGGAGVAG